MNTVRPMAVANRFYPGRESEARAWMVREIEKASRLVHQKPWAIVCPHAGWYYCLDLAALSWIQTQNYHYDRILFVGPSHYERFSGWVIDEHPGWETPLGIYDQDQEFADRLLALKNWRKNSVPHLPEHCLEVIIPWVGLLHPGAKIVTAIHGSPEAEEEAERLAELLGDNDLIVISTDLSHYLSASAAEKKDRELLDLLEKGRPDLAPSDSACGLGALRLLGRLAQLKKSQIQVLAYHHSGQVSGDLTRVVGYASAVAV